MFFIGYAAGLIVGLFVIPWVSNRFHRRLRRELHESERDLLDAYIASAYIAGAVDAVHRRAINSTFHAYTWRMEHPDARIIDWDRSTNTESTSS